MEDTPLPQTFTFHHAELGTLNHNHRCNTLVTDAVIRPLTGFVSPDNVVQFRGIPFATIPKRFAQSIPLTSLPGTNRDFTEYGPACPQTFPAHITGGGPLPDDPEPIGDELECLNLQLNIPLSVLQSLQATRPSSPKLPLLIYIHGGGFVLGRIDAQHNTAPLVAQSLTSSTLLMSASIQYRLGALGYLHVPESGTANRALNDQRHALLWLQRFIGGFGGDVRRTTVFGESAGSMSICLHMMNKSPPSRPLFSRAVLMSGIVGPMTAPISLSDAESVYEDFLTKFGIEEKGKEGLEKLRNVEIEKLLEITEKMNEEGHMWLTVQDEDWFGDEAGKVTWDRVPELMGKCSWVEDIVLGTTGAEGAMFMDRAAGITPSAWLAGIEKQLGPANAAALGKAYSVTPDMDQNLFTTRMLQWMGDVVFDAPTHALARYLTTHTDKNVFRYLFNIRNPFPLSPFHGTAHHWVDVYFVFTTFLFRFPTRFLKAVSTKHAQLWIAFASGKAPWGEYKYAGNGEERIMVADEREGWVERSVKEQEGGEETEGWGRREALWEAWKGRRGEAFLPLKIEAFEGRRFT